MTLEEAKELAQKQADEFGVESDAQRIRQLEYRTGVLGRNHARRLQVLVKARRGIRDVADGRDLKAGRPQHQSGA